jgi:hypothetical protein
MQRILLTTLALCAACSLGAAAFAQQPPVDVAERRGNMRAARQLIQRAWQKVNGAQQDNNCNLGGHAGRAKELLSQASEQIKLRAEAANPRRQFHRKLKNAPPANP